MPVKNKIKFVIDWLDEFIENRDALAIFRRRFKLTSPVYSNKRVKCFFVLLKIISVIIVIAALWVCVYFLSLLPCFVSILCIDPQYTYLWVAYDRIHTV